MKFLRHLLVAPITGPILILAFLYFFSSWFISNFGKVGKKVGNHLMNFGEYISLFILADNLLFWAEYGRFPKKRNPFLVE